MRGQRADARRAVGREVGELDRRLRIGGRDRRDRAHAHAVVRTPLVRVVDAAHDDRSRAVRGRADVEQAERVRHQRRVEHVVDRHFLAVARIRVLEAVLGVLHLYPGEVLARRAEQLHAATGVQTEVRRVGRAQQPEPQPVGVVAPLALVGCEEALRRRVGADHQRNVAEPGEDLRPRGRQRGDARRARRVRRRDLRAVPTQRLGEGRAGDVAGVAVAHGLSARHELDVAPLDARFGQRSLRGDDAVLDEVAAPLAPRVHARAEHDDVLAHAASTSGPRSPGRRIWTVRASGSAPRCRLMRKNLR